MPNLTNKRDCTMHTFTFFGLVRCLKVWVWKALKALMTCSWKLLSLSNKEKKRTKEGFFWLFDIYCFIFLFANFSPSYSSPSPSFSVSSPCHCILKMGDRIWMGPGFDEGYQISKQEWYWCCCPWNTCATVERYDCLNLIITGEHLTYQKSWFKHNNLS